MRSDNFSLMRGGPVYRLVRGIGRLFPRVRRLDALFAAILLLVAFVPLALLAWRDGTLLPGRVTVPLSGDYLVLARFVVAMPLLVLAARFSDTLLRGAVRRLFRGGVVPESGRMRFEEVLVRARRARDAWWPEMACLAVALVPSLMPALMSQLALPSAPGLTTWRQAPDGGMSAAGAWLGFVAAPLFRFLVLLWLWRFLLWSWMLWRFSRLHMDLRVTHPDRAGGLAFLGLAQTRFAALSAAGALVVCGHCLNQMVHAGQTAFDLRYLVAGYVLGATLVLLVPVLLMSTSMARAKRHGFARYDALGHRAAKAFDDAWMRGPSESRGDILESPAPSALADYSGVYANLVGMSIVPVNRWNLLRMLLAALLPFAPMAFVAMSLDELAKRLFSVLL